MGIVDALGEGFRLVVRRPLLLAIPLLLDLLLLLLPPISILGPSLGTPAPASQAELAPPLRLEFTLLLVLFVPSTLALGGSDSAFDKSPVELEGIGTAIMAALLLGIASIAIATAYLGTVVRAVRSEQGEADLVGLITRKLPQMLALVLGAAALLGLAGLALGLMLVGFGSVANSLPGVITIPLLLIAFAGSAALTIASIVGSFVMFFAILALMLEPLTARQSVRRAASFLRKRPGPPVLFATVAWFVQFGLGLIWVRLSASTPGTLLAFLGSAFIGTAITAASMLFYLSLATDRADPRQRQDLEA